jgi:hypothetical protein
MFVIKGEPAIVAETRERILMEFSDLEFHEDGHIYILNGCQLPSVTQLAHRFIREPFDEEQQAERYAQRHGETAEYWKREWHKNSFRATALGTKTHEFGESLAYLRAGHPEMIRPSVISQYSEEYHYLAPIHPKEEAVVHFLDALPPSYHLVLNEARIYSGKHPDASCNLSQQDCGTFDMLYYYDGGGNPEKAGFIIFDYKTNKCLENDLNLRFGKYLREPFNDLVEQDLSLYTIQLSLYALMLEDIGLKIIDRKLIWLKEDGTFEKKTVPDVTEKLRECL